MAKRTSPGRTFNILERWDYLCIICGEPFDNIYTCSYEHIICATFGGKAILDNLAPSHYYCNQLRGASSLVFAMKHMNDLKNKDYLIFKQKIREISFQKLLNSNIGIALSGRSCKKKPDNENKPVEHFSKKDTRNLVKFYKNEL